MLYRMQIVQITFECSCLSTDNYPSQSETLNEVES